MLVQSDLSDPPIDLLRLAGRRRFSTILADPPWQFINKTGKVAPEHKRLSRYGTMKLNEIMALPVEIVRVTRQRRCSLKWARGCDARIAGTL
jgi:hypothetical protein